MIGKGAYGKVYLYENDKGHKIIVKCAFDNDVSRKSIQSDLFHHKELSKKDVKCIPKLYGTGYFGNNNYIKAEYLQYSI